jgi:hypothetical protein
MARPRKLDILSILTSRTSGEIINCETLGLGPPEELSLLPPKSATISAVRDPNVSTIISTIKSKNPNAIYIVGHIPSTCSDIDITQPLAGIHLENAHHDHHHQSNGDGEKDAPPPPPPHVALLTSLSQAASSLHLVYLDAPSCTSMVDVLRKAGVDHVICWENIPLALPATIFAHAFFSLLSIPHMAVPEACALATYCLHYNLGHFTGNKVNNEIDRRLGPSLISDSPPLPPAINSVPPLEVGGVQLANGSVSTAVPEYGDIRLLAPQSELILLVAGTDLYSVNIRKMMILCDLLRAVVTAEVRVLSLQSPTAPCVQAPLHLPPGSIAINCEVVSASGAKFEVVLGGPPEILGQKPLLVQHALRQTLAADANALQVRIPPLVDETDPSKQSIHSNFAGEAPFIDVTVATSVWCVQMLTALAADKECRSLVGIGIVAVGQAPVVGWTTHDRNRVLATFAGLPDSDSDSDVSDSDEEEEEKVEKVEVS